MKLTLAPTQFDQCQAILVAEIVARIHLKLQEAGIAEDQQEDLTAGIALSITGVLDDLAVIEDDGLEVHPYLTFRGTDAELIHCGENAATHEFVYAAMQRLLRLKHPPAT